MNKSKCIYSTLENIRYKILLEPDSVKRDPLDFYHTTGVVFGLFGELDRFLRSFNFSVVIT